MITFNLDFAQVFQFGETLGPRLESALRTASEDLASRAHAHLLDLAKEELHSTKDKYTDAVNFEQINDSTWHITLDSSMAWLEDGMPEHEMIDSLLKSPKAKMSRDGHKYMSVPFQHNKGPSKQTQAAQDLTATVRRELKKRQIPYGKIERDEGGKAKTGLLHSFDIMNKPVKTHEGPGQGHGKIGEVRQGNTGIPFLQSIRIYQRKMADGKIKKGIMTFRTVSTKHRGSGKWVHPGIEPRKFMDKTAEWVLEEWDRMMPKILEDFNKNS